MHGEENMKFCQQLKKTLAFVVAFCFFAVISWVVMPAQVQAAGATTQISAGNDNQPNYVARESTARQIKKKPRSLLPWIIAGGVVLAVVLVLLVTGCATPRPQRADDTLFWRLDGLECQVRRYHHLCSYVDTYVGMADKESPDQVVGSTNVPLSPSAAALQHLEESRVLLQSIERATATLKAELDRVDAVVRKHLDDETLKAMEANPTLEPTRRSAPDGSR